MKLLRKMKNESGAYTVITAIVMTLLVACLALSVDIGYHFYRGAQLQNAADAAVTAVAGNIGTIDTQYDDIAYEYLAKNGFPHYDKNGKEIVHCHVTAKAEVAEEGLYTSEDYIQAGYYKLEVSSTDKTFFAKIIDFDELSMEKVAYAKATADYEKMPKALNYTVFGAATVREPEVADRSAIEINGKTGDFVEYVTNGTQDIINGFNDWVVKPIQAFTITPPQNASSWLDYLNPFNYSVGFDYSDANAWRAKLSTSKLTTSGDVHSNSDINISIASINANRIQDSDLLNTMSAKQIAELLDVTPIQDLTPTVQDYGQVTFTAVRDILFSRNKKDSNGNYKTSFESYYYVQNQQYLEQIQLTMSIIDLIDANDMANCTTVDGFRELYEDAAELYLDESLTITTAKQKQAIINNKENLYYNADTKTVTIFNQHNIIYSLSQKNVEDALKIVRDRTIDSLYLDESDGADSIAFKGADYLYKDTTTNKVDNDNASGFYSAPYYALRTSTRNSATNAGDEFDNHESMKTEEHTVSFSKTSGNTTTEYKIVASGDVINREYQSIASGDYANFKLPWGITASSATETPQSLADQTKLGAQFAAARTFIQDSEYIETPNLKPYFTRQVNESVKNATRTREKLNTTNAGQPTIRYAARERKNTLKTYLGTICSECGTAYSGDALDPGETWTCSSCGATNTTLTYYDDTYKAQDSSTLNNLVKSNNPLFKEFKYTSSGRVINLNDSSNESYTRTTTDGLTYSVSISGKAYKGYEVYNGNVLKTPGEFYTEYLAKRNNSGKKSGAQAVKKYYNDTAKTEFNAVAAKYTELDGNDNFKYSTMDAAVKQTIDDEGKPAITQGEQSVTPKVTGISLPTASDVFLGDGTSVGSKVTVGTNTLRTNYNSVLSSNAFAAESNFIIPSAGTSPYTNNQGSKGSVSDGDYSMVNNSYYSSIEAPYYSSWGTKWRKNVIVPAGYNVLVTGIFKLDAKNTNSSPNLTLNSSSKLIVGGNLEITHGGGGNCTLNSGSTLVVNGSVTVNNGGTLTVGDNATMYVTGNIEVSNLVLGTNAKLYCKGTLQAARTVTIGSGAVLYSKGNMTFPYQKNYTNKLVNNGMVICDSIISAEDEPITNNSGCLIIAKGGLIASVASDNNSIINYGNIYVSGDINAAGAVYTTGGTIQVLGGIYAANSNGNDILHTNGACSVYVRGVLSTTNGSNKNFWIDSGGAATVSILGVGGSTDVFNGKLNKFYVNCAGSNVYFGGDAKINTGSEEFLNSGNLYVYGSLTVPTTAAVTFTKAYKTVIKENLTASNTSGLSVKENHLLYVFGNISVSTITVDGSSSKVHADGTINAVGALNLTNGGLLEGVGGVSAGSYNTSGGDFNSIKTITFSGNITANDIPNGYLSGGSVSGDSMTLNNVKLKVEGDLNLNSGALTLTNGSVLYVTGVLRCGAISLNNSKLYADGGITCTTITEANKSLILVKKGSKVASSGYSNIAANGKVTLGTESKLYLEGQLTGVTSVDCAGSSLLYGYNAINLNADYVDDNTGSFKVDGSASRVFCGANSATSKNVGINANGELYYPYKSDSVLKCNHFYVNSSGKVIIDGTEGVNSCTISSWALIESSGIFCNHGKTTVTGCRITTYGMMYLLGGHDVTGADTSDMTGGDQQSAPSYYYFKISSTTYLGKNYNGNTKLDTLSYVSNYESWGDVYIDSNVTVTGYIEDFIQNILGVKTEKGGKDLYSNEGVRVGHLGTAVYIPKGVTYVNGNMTTYANTSKDSAILIGKYEDSTYDTQSGLVINGDISLASPVANYGKFMVRGEYALNSANPQKCTEKNSSDKYKEGKSLINGRTEGSPTAVFFVGNYKADGSIKNASNYVTFWGDVENRGNIYFNTSTLDVRGYNNEVGTPAGDFAFLNFAGAKAHIGGNVRLNSNQLFNKWKSGSNECIFSCDGKLTYGGCLFNCGTVVVGGDITNNEDTSETVNNKNYLTNHFSLMNGFYKLNKDVRTNFASRVYPESELFCGGNMQFGITEQGGESGSVISCGNMYISGNVDIFTNASSFKLTLENLKEFWNNPESHSYFRTALWLYDNSNTFIGGSCFAGAGVATGRDSIFMCGGDYRSKRSTKVGIEMFMGTSALEWTSTFDDYMSYKENTGTNYSSAYFYVGGNALVNTIGSTVKAFGVVTAPENNSRDMDIYPNTNMYVGGSLYANCKVYMKDNVDMVVAGNKTFYDNNGNILPTIYTNMFSNLSNFVPEKNITNGHTVRDNLNNNKTLKFYVYQSFDMMPNSSLIVNGAMQVNDTAKIRDMTKTYIYGSFVGGKYVEVGKALDDKDKTAILSNGDEAEELAKDSSGNYMYLTDAEIAEIGRTNEKTFIQKYDFDKSAYMFVNGDFTSGADVGGTSVLGILDRIGKWFQNTFFSTGYTKVYASSSLRVNGNLTSNRYITLRHDAKVYCKGDMEAATSIEGAAYTEWYVGGNMSAATSAVTKVIDAIGGLFNLTSRGKIEMMDQARVIVGGNMFSSATIELGENKSGEYYRGRKDVYDLDKFRKTGYSMAEGGTDFYEEVSDFEEALILYYRDGQYYDKSGNKVYLDGSTYKYSDLKDSDNKNIEFGSKDNVIVFVESDGKYHKNTYDGDVTDYSESNTDDSTDERAPDANDGLLTTDEDTYGAEVFCQGTLIAQNGYIKEHAYTVAVVGDYVYAPDYITLRSNSDLWVLPEAFDLGTETYRFLPYPEKPEDIEYVYTCPHGHTIVSATKLTSGAKCTICDDGDCDKCIEEGTGGNVTIDVTKYETQQGHKAWYARLYENVKYYIGKFAYETSENFKFKAGSVYTFGSLTVNKNASLMGTNDLLQLGSFSAADNSKFNSLFGTLFMRKVVLREDSLVFFGNNVTITSAPASISLDVLKGNESVAGFDSKGTATEGYRYYCTNPKAKEHGGYSYYMGFSTAQNESTLTCDCCGAAVKSGVKAQISYPAIVYAGNNVYISTTIDMQMTYIIADQGSLNQREVNGVTVADTGAGGVYINNLYTKAAHDQQNFKELPNAVCSYLGNIEYNCWVSQLSSLFYAPNGDISFDGIYDDIYGSVIGKTVTMKAFYQNFHRFENWRTMDLHIAKSDDVYLIPESEWDSAPDNVMFDLTSGTEYQDSPYGVRIFF